MFLEERGFKNDLYFNPSVDIGNRN